MENRYLTYKKLVKKPLGFLDEEYIKDRDERIYNTYKRKRRNLRQKEEIRRIRLQPKPL